MIMNSISCRTLSVTVVCVTGMMVLCSHAAVAETPIKLRELIAACENQTYDSFSEFLRHARDTELYASVDTATANYVTGTPLASEDSAYR